MPYKTTVALIKRDLNKGTAVTLSDVKDDIRQIYGSMKHMIQRKGETALMGKAFKKQFKGDCRICGKKGHKGADCWTLDKNKSKRPKGVLSRNDTANVSSNTYIPYSGPPCGYCKMANHPTEKCFKKIKDDKAKGIKPQINLSVSTDEVKDRAEVMMIAATREEIEMLMSTTTGPSSLTMNTFIADSGASCHMRNSTVGMFDLKDHIQPITVGNSAKMLSKYKGKYRGTIIQQDGTYTDLVLHDVLYIPDLWLNLISLTKAIK
jgi:hypothetical protein